MNETYREDYDLLVGSGLHALLVERGMIVAHDEADLSLAAAPGAHRVLRPERIGFVSYPYEWCFGQLKAAAMLTLEIQRVAMDHGMSLRDASAYNIQFRDGRAVLIDTLSFEKLREGEPWVAYRQFCQHFLAPLALMAYRDVRLGQLSRIHLDGVPLDLAASLLPRRARLRAPLLMHVFAHARTQGRQRADTAAENVAAARRRGFGLQAFRGLVSSLESGVRKLECEPGSSTWSGYYSEANSYTDAALDHKRLLVEEFVREARPSSVWDLGGNTGMFSRIATGLGIPTVCFDGDPAVVEENHRTVVSKGETNLLPLVMDLANPSPAIGWENRERMTLAQRGPADLVLALALVHHLAIGNNVPLARLAGFFRELCGRLVVEFVPKSDPKVRTLLAAREDVFPGYTEGGFEEAFGARFDIERREPVKDSERVLYLMRSR